MLWTWEAFAWTITMAVVLAGPFYVWGKWLDRRDAKTYRITDEMTEAAHEDDRPPLPLRVIRQRESEENGGA